MTKSQLIKSIYDAWEGVELGNGTGLWEARMIDDYYPPEHPDYIRVKNKDERKDWKKLLPIFLHPEKPENYVSDTWIFMDAEGARFHLPLFLIQEVEVSSILDLHPLISTLTHEVPSIYSDRLKILSSQQRQVVLEFLDFQIADFKKHNPEEDYDFLIKDHQLARENFLKFYMV